MAWKMIPERPRPAQPIVHSHSYDSGSGSNREQLLALGRIERALVQLTALVRTLTPQGRAEARQVQTREAWQELESEISRTLRERIRAVRDWPGRLNRGLRNACTDVALEWLGVTYWLEQPPTSQRRAMELTRAAEVDLTTIDWKKHAARSPATLAWLRETFTQKENSLPTAQQI